MSDKIGLFTGSFDPVTLGHLDLISRAGKLFDTLYVGLFYNQAKVGYFSLESRLKMLREAVSDLGNVKVISLSDRLTVDCARELGVTHLVRGLRNAADLEYEAGLAFYNNYLAEELETILLLSKHEYRYLSSSSVRELLYFKADISGFVPQSVIKEMEKENLEKT